MYALNMAIAIDVKIVHTHIMLFDFKNKIYQ